MAFALLLSLFPLLLSLLSLLVAAPARASGPSSNRVLNYQLRLSDASGIPVANGTKNIKLTFYTLASGGSQLYTACSADGSATGTPTAVVATFASGTSSILIGSALTCASGSSPAIPATLFDNTAMFLGVTVEADAEMTPRKRIVAAGYALNADKLDDLDTSAVGGSSAFVPVTDTSGNFTLTQNATFGDAATDNIAFNGDINSHVIPNTDDTFDLGSNTQRWRDLYLGPATLHIGTAIGDEGSLTYNTATNVLNIDSTGTVDINGGSASTGCSVDASGNFACSGTVSGGSGSISGSGSAGQATFWTGASTVAGDNNFFWDNSNKRLGIGNAAPSLALDVLATGSAGTARFRNNTNSFASVDIDSGLSAADFSVVRLFDRGTNKWELRKNSSNNFDIRDASVPSVPFTIESGTPSNAIYVRTSTGNVGIGTSTASEKLQVAGNGRFGNISVGDTAANFVNLDTQVDGNVLLSSNLSVNDLGQLVISNTHAADSGAGIHIPGNGRPRQGSIEFWTTPTGAVTAGNAFAQSSPRVVIDNNGSLGIGDASPASMLTVGNGDLFQVGSDGDLDRVKNIPYSWPAAQGAATTVLTNDGAGNLSWTAASGGTAFLQNGNSFGAAATIGTNDAFDLNFETSGTTKMTVLSGGNVGIGDTTPAATFTVGNGDLFQVAGTTGNVTTSGDVAVNGADLTTTAATGNLFNTTATTVNVGGAATTMNVGPAGATAASVNLAGGFGATGCTVDGATGTMSCSGSLVAGANSSATGSVTQIALGSNADTSNPGAVAIGSNVAATNIDSFVIGATSSGTLTNGLFQSLAIGFGSTSPTVVIRGLTSGASAVKEFELTGQAHTNMANVEANDFDLNLARTVQFAGGAATITNQRASIVRAPSYSAVTAGLALTNAATLAVSGAPTAGANVTISNPLALWVQGGTSQFDGDISTTAATFNLINTSATTLNIGGAATTLNLAGGSGSTGCTVDGSGNLACSGTITGSGAAAFVQGGNSFGTTATLGTNDAFDLNFETTNTARMTLQADGDLAVDTSTLFVDAANNIVAVGTAAPAASNEFTVKAQASNTANVLIESGQGTQFAINAVDLNRVQLGSLSNVPMDFFTNGTGRMFIDTAGNVGIGDSTPDDTLDLEFATAAGNGIIVNQMYTGDPQTSYQLAGTTTWVEGIDNSDSDRFKIQNGAALNTTNKGVEIQPNYLIVQGGSDVRAYIGDDGFGNDMEIGSQKAGVTNAAYWNSADSARMNVYMKDLLVADGAAATPSIKFENDQNTGLFRAATDVLGFSTAGAERMRIDAAGRVGVGTASPENLFEVANLFRYGTNGNEVLIGDSAGGTTSNLRDYNVMIGYQTGFQLGTASYNTGVGTFSLQGALTGSYNTAMGYATANGNTSGSGNTSIGTFTNYYVTTGGYNTALGYYGGIGGATLTTGSYNTFVGYSTGVNSASAARRTAVGYAAQSDCDDCLVLGSGAFVGVRESAPNVDLTIRQNNSSNGGSGGLQILRETGSNNWRINLDSINQLVFAYNSSWKNYMRPTDGGWFTTSDQSLKKDVAASAHGLNDILALRPVTFRYNEQPESDPVSYGFIAQEVKPILPELVAANPGDGLLAMNYTGMIPVLAKAIQELAARSGIDAQAVRQTTSLAPDGTMAVNLLNADLVRSRVYTVKNAGANKTAGTGVIPPGAGSVTVQNANVDAKSLLSITFKDDPGSRWWIGQQDPGSFTVRLAEPSATAIRFTYWIVGVEDGVSP
ncbi:MAG TPA: tail fiber domain-containing protein [Candidatus Eisenbacteria bacterium]|nr:tail fiber domain-containing protein [Candidatus Eisenbacteria bacterium]